MFYYLLSITPVISFLPSLFSLNSMVNNNYNCLPYIANILFLLICTTPLSNPQPKFNATLLTLHLGSQMGLKKAHNHADWIHFKFMNTILSTLKNSFKKKFMNTNLLNAAQ